MLAYSSSVSIYHVADPTFSKIFWLSLKPAQLIIVFPNRRNPGDVTNKGIFEWVLCFDDFLISERHHVAKSYKCTNWILKQNMRIIRTPFAIGQSGHSECLLRRLKKKKKKKKNTKHKTKQDKMHLLPSERRMVFSPGSHFVSLNSLSWRYTCSPEGEPHTLHSGINCKGRAIVGMLSEASVH